MKTSTSAHWPRMKRPAGTICISKNNPSKAWVMSRTGEWLPFTRNPGAKFVTAPLSATGYMPNPE